MSMFQVWQRVIALNGIQRLFGHGRSGARRHRSTFNSRFISRIETMENRQLLSAQNILLGSYALSDLDRSPALLAMRQGTQVDEIREALANVDERTEDLGQLNLAVGPYDLYDGESMYYGSSSHYYPLETVAYGRIAVPASPNGMSPAPFTFTQPWAEAYDEEAYLIELGDIAGALPALYSQSFAEDFHDFVPDAFTNSTSTTTHAFNGTVVYGLQLTVSATHTITRTFNAATGSWTYAEDLSATYSFVKLTTNWQEPVDNFGFPSAPENGFYDLGNPYSGSFTLNRIAELAGSGTFDYEFEASGTGTAANAKIGQYSLDSWGLDEFKELMTCSATPNGSGGSGEYSGYGGYEYGGEPGSGSTLTETVTIDPTYGYLAQGASGESIRNGVMSGRRDYTDHIEATFTWTGSQWASIYTEEGAQNRSSSVYHLLSWERTAEDSEGSFGVAEFGMTGENLTESSSGYYEGAGTYSGGAVTPTEHVGTRRTTSALGMDYHFTHNGAVLQWDETSWTGPTGAASITANRYLAEFSDDVDRELTVSYVDLETFFADGSRQLETTQSNQITSTLTVNFVRSKESLMAGNDTRIRDVEVRGINGDDSPELYVEIESLINKDLTTLFAADGTVVDREGTDANVGSVFFQRSNSVEREYDYERTFTDQGILNSGTQLQSDRWSEVLVDQYSNEFNHLTVYHADDTLTEFVDDVGHGAGTWHLVKAGTYDWIGSGDDWNTRIEENYAFGYGDAWLNEIDTEFAAVHTDSGTPISKDGHHTISNSNAITRFEMSMHEYHMGHGYSNSSGSSEDPMSGSSSVSLTIDHRIIRDSDDWSGNEGLQYTHWSGLSETRYESSEGSGSGSKVFADNYDYVFAQDWSYGGWSGAYDHHHWQDTNDEQEYHYEYIGSITQLKPSGASSFSRSGAVYDLGWSIGERTDSSGFIETETNGSSSTTRYSYYNGRLTFALSYAIQTQYAGLIQTRIGIADVFTTYSWIISWMDQYSSGSSSGSGSGIDSLMPDFDVLRSGRRRVIPWETPPFEVGNELRRPESWYAQAGVPVTRWIDLDPHDVSGYSGWYGEYYGYWYGYPSGLNFN